ncbi:MAG: SpoIIE family protein phosphatase [Actinomycetota bacterium]|nr:SpoIIE family protein phosphatase [Actinomycetota bacterium]
MVVGLVVASVLAVIDAVGSRDALFIGVLVAGPLLTSFGASARATALVAAYTVVLALVVGVAHDVFLELEEHLTRVLTVVVGGAIAIWIASARSRERAVRRRYSLLAHSGEIVQRTLDPDVMMVEVARLLARELGDWCFVFLRREPRGIRPVAAVHRDPERERLASELLSRYPLDPRRDEGPAATMRDGKPRLYETVDERLLASISADEDNLKLLEALGMSSVLVVPLTAHGRTFGSMAIAAAESGQVYEKEDLDLAVELADRVAAAADNARLYSELSGTETELRRSRDELQAILDGVADAVTAQGAGDTLVFANQAAVESFGYSSLEELLAAPTREIVDRFEFYDEDGQPFPIQELPGRRALAGDPAPPPALTRFRLKAGGPTRWVRVKALPVFDEDGKPVLAINIMEDVTEERELAEAQTFLAEAGRILSSSLDYDTTLTNVARLAVPRIGDWCSVDLVEEDGGVRPVVVAHVDPAKVEWAKSLREQYPPDPSQDQGVHRVLRTGESELYPHIPRELLVQATQDEEHLRLIDEIGMRSAMIAPLSARGRTLGAITFVSSESGRHFDQGDLLVAEELAARCALAVDNARLFGERTHIARTLQQSLLPPELPQPPGLDVAARFQAAGEGYEVGGDFYDVFDTGAERWAAVIGDVCGKGPEAAAVTALARYTLRTTAMTQHVPSRILATLNEAMLRQRTDRRFSTVLFASLDRRDGGTCLRFSSGGHPLPLILRASGDAGEVGTPGTLLGIVPDPDLTDEEVPLRPGDAVILYTDGVTDAAAPDFVREPHDLADALRGEHSGSADAIAERVLQLALGAGNGSAIPRDDIAILVIKVADRPPAALSQ